MYGKHGFNRPLVTQTDVSFINVGELDELAPSLVERAYAHREGWPVTIDLDELGIDKLLGNGRVAGNT